MVAKASGKKIKTTGLDDENSILPDAVHSPVHNAIVGN